MRGIEREKASSVPARDKAAGPDAPANDADSSKRAYNSLSNSRASEKSGIALIMVG